MINKNTTKVQVDSLEYRGFNIAFYYDDETQQFFTIVNDQVLAFGIMNNKYKDEMKLLIDKQLDTILDDGKLVLTYFNNNGYRDIKLVFMGRIIKVYLVSAEESVDIDKIKADAKFSVRKYLSAKLTDL